ncbi:glutathione S-transferase family protein [Microvirga soli]|uniref:glutathione S-transferase family protein n=1 Tax=Microvirga soli TaxID=1854496 RepID=UPI00191D0D56|nr:glutathione S-transferase family protein [Microvirga soli]
MTLKLYAHPFSSYCQKVLIALYENGTPFEYLTLDDTKNGADLEALWPIKKFPVLIDQRRTILEASIIIEHLDLHHPGPVCLIPEDPRAALEVRLMDRFFDNYVMTPMQKIVADRIRQEQDRDPYGVSEARAMLDKAYGWLDRALSDREWAAGAAFSLADCAAAPALFYADWAHPISDRYPRVRDYRQTLLALPSFAQAVDEARPYRPYFPLGAPDRD